MKTGLAGVRGFEAMRPPTLFAFFVCGFVVVLIWRCWPYLVSGLAVVGIYHLWTRYHRNP